jgi:hypothetical protein
MNINNSGYLTILLFIGIAVFGFLIWVGAIFLLWLLLQAAGIIADFWVMTESLSLAAAAALGLSAGFVAYRELSESASSRHLDVADRLFEELNSYENIEARRWVFLNLHGNPEEDVELLSDEGRAAIKQVLNSLDHVAFLTQAEWIPDEIIMPWMHPMIAKSWQKLQPYVIYERQRRHESGYYLNVSDLARRCQTWEAANLPDWKITWIEDAL